jgi:hypothetical protein
VTAIVHPPPAFLEGLGGVGAHYLDLAELRRRVAAWMASHAGLRSSGATESDYEALILPDDDPAWRHRYADEAWSCALRYRAALRYLGVNHPLITCPYAKRVGRAVEDLATVALAYGALVRGTALEAYEPDAADALCSLGSAGPHVSCVVAVTEEQGPGLAPVRALRCVDGGGGSRNNMAIDANLYAWEPGAMRDIEPPKRSIDRPGPKRPTVWAIDTAKLIVEAGLLKDRG